MNPILAYQIFLLNYREFQSRRIFLLPIMLVVIVSLLPYFFWSLSLGKGGYYRLSNEVSLNAIGYCGLALALYLGSTSYRTDLENKTLHTLISHPISLYNYHLGKFLAGNSLLLVAHLFAATTYCLVIAGASRCPPDYQIIWTGFSLGMGACVIYGFCYACSTRCSAALAGTAGAAVFIIGSMSSHLLQYFTLQDRGDYHVFALAESIRALLPKLLVFDTTLCSTHLLKIPDDYIFCCGIYWILWTTLFLLTAVALTTKADL